MIIDEGAFSMKTKRLVDLNDGDVFMYNNGIYMKVAEPYDLKLPIQKGVKLTTGAICQFEAYQDVIFCPYVVLTSRK